jgi:hypothetical protein
MDLQGREGVGVGDVDARDTGAATRRTRTAAGCTARRTATAALAGAATTAATAAATAGAAALRHRRGLTLAGLALTGRAGATGATTGTATGTTAAALRAVTALAALATLVVGGRAEAELQLQRAGGCGRLNLLSLLLLGTAAGQQRELVIDVSALQLQDEGDGSVMR